MYKDFLFALSIVLIHLWSGIYSSIFNLELMLHVP